MCGIAGYFTKTSEASDTLQAMIRSIAHRGPDGEGQWQQGRVALAHRRLSIIDLSPEAAQPMHSADGTLHIVFNGEIYNYKDLRQQLLGNGTQCRTGSDTEVILHLYQAHGMAAFKLLRGMFALAMWDDSKKELLLVRDRLGIKPLYYLFDDDGIFFASEIKAIAVARPKLTFDRSSFWRFLRTSTFMEPDTVFNEIKRVQPGTCMTVSGSGIIVTKFWSLDEVYAVPVVHYASEGSAIQKFSDNLEDAVKYHMVADVPVGAFLSGGLDSSIVVSCMKRVEPGQAVRTFSIVFPEEHGRYDESSFSRAVSNHVGTDHAEVTFRPDFLNDLDELAWHCDEPFGILSSYALYYLARHASQFTKVVLTGDGGDELLAGYQGYTNMPVPYPPPARFALRIAGDVARVVQRLSPVLRDQLTVAWIKLLRKGESDGVWFSEHNAYVGSLCYGALNDEFTSEAWQSWSRNSGAEYYEAIAGDSSLRRMLYSSMKARLVDEMLTKVDRMTMAHSLEARVPFLDHRLVESSVSLPDSLKLKEVNGKKTGKYILKKAAEAYLPHDIIWREKHGFDVPFSEWLLRGHLDAIKDSIMNGWLVQERILNRKRIERLLQDHRDRHADHGQFIANLMIFERWYQVYATRIPGFSLSF
jgi:asparagine synthase (glutamine-hydrolysing)